MKSNAAFAATHLVLLPFWRQQHFPAKTRRCTVQHRNSGTEPDRTRWNGFEGNSFSISTAPPQNSQTPAPHQIPVDHFADVVADAEREPGTDRYPDRPSGKKRALSRPIRDRVSAGRIFRKSKRRPRSTQTSPKVKRSKFANSGCVIIRRC
jgi:hypothetical protein